MLIHCAVALLAVPLPANDSEVPEWGGFLGTDGTGIAVEGTYPERLDPDQDLLWRIEVPPGYSSPTVAGERVFLTAAEGESLLTLCYDRGTGDELWRREVGFDGKRPGANSPAAPSPVTDGEFVFSLFHSAGMVAYDVEGMELWHKELGPFAIPHGLSTSPKIAGDLLILQVDHDADSYLMAIDKIDGETVWKVDRKGCTHSYATPAIWTPAEGPAEVIVSGSHRICGYSLEDGELLWWVEGNAFMTKGSPVVVGDECFVAAYTMSYSEAGIPSISQTFEQALEDKDANQDGLLSPDEMGHDRLKQAWFVFDLDDDGQFDEKDYNYLATSTKPTGGLFAVRPGGRGDVTDTHVIWKYDGRRGLPDATSALVVEDQLYLVKSGSLMTAFDVATGEPGKQERVGPSDQYFASPVAADGKIYITGLSGQLVVVKAGAEWEVLSETSIGEETWSTPALANGQVLVRSQKALYCFEGQNP